MESNNKIAPWKLALAYALPNFGLAIMVGPVQGLMQGYYAKHFAITLAQIGGVLFLARIIDAILDPVIGMSSDHFRSRFWGRRSWLVAGATLSLIAIYHLLVVPSDQTITGLRPWIILGFIAWTLSEIPYLAWGTELTSDYDARTKIFSFRTALGFTGALIFLGMPNIIGFYKQIAPAVLTSVANFFSRPDLIPIYQDRFIGASEVTRDYSPLSMQVSFWLLAITVPLFVLVALWVCPGGSHVKKVERKGPVDALRILFSNKAMLIFMGAFAALGIAGGMQIAMAYLHVSVYLGLGQEVSQIYVVGALCSLAGVPMWNWVAKVKGKHIALIAGLSVTCLLYIWLGLLQPHDGSMIWDRPVVFWYYLAIFCGLNFFQVVYYSISPAILGDISEAAMLESREDQSGTYFAVYTFVYKLVIGVGQGLAFLIAGAVFGFNPKEFVQTDHAALGIKLMMAYLPAALVVVAILILLRYPITKKKHEEIQAKIKELGLKTED
jgi:Na+/melibiose symporter-like transporter